MSTPHLIYVGAYTDAGSRGINALWFDPERGKISEPFLAGEASHPSYLAFGPSKKCLYAVDERGSGVAAFTVDPVTGRLTLLNRLTTDGGLPCDLVADPAGRMLIVVNYDTSTVAVFPIEADGRLAPHMPLIGHHGPLGPNPRFQTQGRPHSVRLSPDGRFAVICDLGLDRVYVYRLDRERPNLLAHSPPFARVPPGLGPRHAAFSGDGRFLYIVNGIGGTVSVFAYDAPAAKLDLRQTISSLPVGFSGASYAAAIAVSPDGRHLYASNRDPDGTARGSDSLAVFQRDPMNGALQLVEIVPTGGRMPRHFAISPDGRWLLAANQMSDRIELFRRDPGTGRLVPTGHGVGVSRPVCLLFR